jgi:hypothetical protein
MLQPMGFFYFVYKTINMANNTEVDIITINTAPAEQNMKKLSQQLKETREEMGRMRLAGEETSEAYKDLANRAGELQRAIELTQKDVKEASTTFTNTVSYVSGSLAGVSGAVQAATGALSLMGVEMGNDTKLMKVLVAAMSITSGLQAIQGSVEAFKMLRTNIMRSTLAQQGFNSAIKANPVMFAVSGVLALVSALAVFAKKSKDAAKESEEAMKAAADAAKERWEQRINEINRMLTDMAKTSATGADFWNYEEFERGRQEYIKQLQEAGKDLGEAYRDITNQQRKYRQEMTNPEWMKTHETEYRDFIENQRRLTYIMSESEGQLTKEMQEAWGNAGIMESNYNTQLQKQREEAEKARRQAAQAAQKEAQAKADAAAKAAQAEADAAQKEIEAEKKRIEDLKKSWRTEIQELTDTYNEQKALMEKHGEDTAELTERYIKERNRILKEQAAETATSQINTHQLELDAEYYRQRLAIIEKGGKDMEKALAELDFTSIDNERTILKERYDNRLITAQEFETELLRLETEASERRVEIKQQEADRKKEIDRASAQAALETTSQLTNIMGSMAEIIGQDTEAYKNIKAAQAIINTIAGAVAAFMGITESTSGWGTALAIAKAAAVTAAGMAEVQKIYAVDTTGGKNSTSTSSAAVSTLSQNYNNTRLLTNGGGVYDLSRLEPQQNTRVYVLTHDIEESLNRVQVTQRRNTF